MSISGLDVSFGSMRIAPRTSSGADTCCAVMGAAASGSAVATWSAGTAVSVGEGEGIGVGGWVAVVVREGVGSMVGI